MKIRKIHIENFRLLKNCKINLHDTTTVIVGRNNSGKTSVTEIFRRFLFDSKSKFALEDFSLSVLEQFWEAYELYKKSLKPEVIREVIPKIVLQFEVEYCESILEYGLLSDFIVDLDPECTTTIIRLEYRLKDGGVENLFGHFGTKDSEPDKGDFYVKLKEIIPKQYDTCVFAISPINQDDEKILEIGNVRKLLQINFINAQRTVDDITNSERSVLGKILEKLFTSASSVMASEGDKQIAQKLSYSIKEVEKSVNTTFEDQLKMLLPTLNLFGYPGLSDPGIKTETSFDVNRILINHTRVCYAGVSTVNLPESFNGLGSRNLIYILLKLFEYFKAYMACLPSPGINLIFIEEPEAHLHPQMQEVFIRKLKEIKESFEKYLNIDSKWIVQFVVSTHSSHIANEAAFDTVRYFTSQPETQDGILRETTVKDLQEELQSIDKENIKFLHQYLTLTRCDLFFADFAILIEGTSERLLFPKMIFDFDKQDHYMKLSSKYICIMEVGGAYAHLFLDLLGFLEIPSLIVTDIDSVMKVGKSYEICSVSSGERTSNACIKHWFHKHDISIGELLSKTDQEKQKGKICIAYQIPEHSDQSGVGRSFEEAFILANQNLFTEDIDTDNLEKSVWEYAQKLKKSEFALRFAIKQEDWITPAYIEKGLTWLNTMCLAHESAFELSPGVDNE